MHKRSTGSNGPEMVHTIPGDSILVRHTSSSRLRKDSNSSSGSSNASAPRRANPHELYEISSVLKPVPGYEKPWEMAPPKYWGQLRQLFIEESLKKRQLLEENQQSKGVQVSPFERHDNISSSSSSNSSNTDKKSTGPL